MEEVRQGQKVTNYFVYIHVQERIMRIRRNDYTRFSDDFQLGYMLIYGGIPYKNPCQEFLYIGMLINLLKMHGTAVFVPPPPPPSIYRRES